MERWKKPHRRGSDPAAAAHTRYPSFSSSLLDAIDRSIDRGGTFGGRREGRPAEGGLSACETRARLHCEPLDTKQHGVYARGADERCFRRRAAEYDHYGRFSQQRQHRDRFFGNSTSSSSESSYGGFSSSEAEAAVPSAPPLPRPVRTSAPPERKPPEPEEGKQTTKGSIRSRFRASKLYGELKKGRSTPVSPGARIASFLNTLFSTAGHPKKAKISPPANPTARTRGGGDDSACSSASSYSRSCLSKTPSSRGKPASSGGSAKRSVRFCPVSVIVDEDCRPCGEKCLYEGETTSLLRRGSLAASEPPLTGLRLLRKEPPPPPPSYLAAMAEVEERKRAREAARGLVDAYKEKKRSLDGFEMDVDDEDEEEEEDDDDAASYSSSDLFELKNLAAVGCGGEVRYRDELPVYETTRLDANRAIARGLTV